MRVVTETHNRHSAIEWCRFIAAVGCKRDDAALVELEDGACCANTCCDWTKFDSHLELHRVVGKNVDKIGDVDLALSLVKLAALRFACVRVIFLAHDRVSNGVFVSVGVETAAAAPRCMVAIQDLLRGQVLHLARLQVVITLDSIDGRVGPGSSARG